MNWKPMFSERQLKAQRLDLDVDGGATNVDETI